MESRSPARRLSLHNTLGWLPVVLLVAGVLNHLWQVQRHQLSPWLGAGFGMFATTDLDAARQVHLIAQLADGSEREVLLAQSYQDILTRARGLPSDSWLDRLAEAVFDALRAGPESEFPAPPVALRIEVWRPVYREGTLALSARPVVSRTYPFPSDGT